MARSIDELIELLNDKDDFVVEDAVGELELRANEAVDPLIDALSSRKKQIRLNSATLLGAIGDPKAIPALVDTLKDNNKLVRSQMMIWAPKTEQGEGDRKVKGEGVSILGGQESLTDNVL